MELEDSNDGAEGVCHTSFSHCVDKLCLVHLKKNVVRQASYSKPKVPLIEYLKPLKRAAYDVLFNRYFKKDETAPTFVEQLLSQKWDEETVTAAFAYRMRTTQRRYHDADRLEGLVKKLLKSDGNRNTIRFLLCLAELSDAPEKRYDVMKRRTAATRDELKKIGRKKELYHGDYPYHVYQAPYTLYPPWHFSRNDVEQPLMYPDRNNNVDQDLFHAKSYATPKSSTMKHSKSLYGLDSEFFSDKGLTDSSYEFDSQTRLYGGLRHSRTFDLDVRLSYPKITGPIDMMASISTSMTSLDEGFVSRPSSPDYSEAEKFEGLQLNRNDKITCLLPYHGYRFPDYDLNIWRDCLKMKRSKHRTWETLGLPAGSTQRKVYITEAGSKIFDEVWQHRARVVHRLASFYSEAALRPPKWISVSQDKLVKHATLVMTGVASNSFQFNRLAQMFVPCENIYFSGVDADAVRSLLLCFSDWGTCYWRLVHFSALSVSTPQKPVHFLHSATSAGVDEEKGVIFKAFADAVRRYLHEYQHQILKMKLENLTLQKLSVILRKAGAQIRYICELCKCGSPGLPPPSIEIAKDFPTGVELLSYLYDEAVNCPEPNHYLALLYLLRKSCLPYLQFVQDWVFRGQCWDVRGEFMLRVNADFGGARQDRQRWLKYVEPVDPNDPGSCVPSFLSSVADEIYTCGKTISLIQFISPEHFLVVDGFDTPDLEITFSKRKLKVIENDWKRHDMKLLKLETERTIHWIKKEEQLRASARRVALMVRRSAKEEIVKMRESIAKEKKERNKIKRKEFERLKKQAEDEAERRVQVIQDEKNEDIKREEARREKEMVKQAEENRLLQEEKEKVISYYEELNMEADRRIKKAAWSNKRNRLHTERRKHMADEMKFWQNQLHAKSPPADIVSEIAEPQKKDIEIQSSLGEELSAISKDFNTDMLQEFLNTTNSRQAGEKSVIQPRQQSDTENALLVIGDKQESVMPPHNATSVHHVSEESQSSPNSEKRMRKVIPGKNVTESLLGFDEKLEKAYIPSTRMVGDKRVSDSNVFREENEQHNTPSTRFVTGKCIADSNIGDLVGVTSVMTTNGAPTKLHRKSVPECGITVTSFENSAPANVPQIRMSEDRKISDSTMGDIIGGVYLETAAPKRFKKQVSGQGVSLSKVGDLMSCADVQLQPASDVSRSKTYDVGSDAVFGADDAPNPSDSTVQNLLYGDVTSQPEFFTMRKVEGRNVSESSVGHLMKLKNIDSQEVDRLRKFALTNKIHGGHHSKSSIQDLMYYDDTVPGNLKKEEAAKLQISQASSKLESVNSSKRHPSYSTLQLIMYPVSEDDDTQNLDDVKSEEKAFHLQLPSLSSYSDVLENKLKKIRTSEGRNNTLDMSPIDLIGNVTGKDIENTYEDKSQRTDEFDWRSDIDSVDVHALPVLLSQCVLRPIMQQVALANRCVLNYFMVDLELPRHFEMLRHFCFMEDGEFSQVLTGELFEKMRSGCRPIDVLNPVVLGSLITQAVQGSAQRNSTHAKKLTFSVHHLPVAFSTSDPSSLDCFTLKYDVGWPCNIVITDANQHKYGQVFGFLLKLKHIMWTLHDVAAKLSVIEYSTTTFITESDLRRLHLYRHEMQNFVKVMQGYVSTQVVHVCWHEFQDALKSAKCLEDLHTLHVEYVRKCVYRCLLTKKTTVVMNVITDVFKTILRFWNQLSSNSVSFTKLKQSYDNFKKFSMFLFKVVSKLVDRGYQPHLEDFLVRLNFNGFYND